MQVGVGRFLKIKGYGMTAYVAPTVEVLGSVEELTLIIPKGTTNTPDGFRLHHTILTSI